jgi:hypothetical protein
MTRPSSASSIWVRDRFAVLRGGERLANGLRHYMATLRIGGKRVPNLLLRLSAPRQPALTRLRKHWVQSPEVHQLHIDAIDIPKTVLRSDPEMPTKAVQGLTQLVNFRTALPRRVAAVSQVEIESEDQLIAYPDRIALSQLTTANPRATTY